MINMIGTAQTMTVIEKEEEFYILEKRGEKVKLPFTNAGNLELAIGDTETVFIYRDYDHEIVATTVIPKAQVGHYAWGTVTEVRKDLGVFVDIGIPKDVVVSMDDMPALNHLWPKKGDRLMIALRVDEKERIWGVLGEEHEFKEIATRATQDMFNQNVTGTVYRLLKVGTFVITEDLHIGFIHETERTSEPRLGQKLDGRVIAVKPDGTLNLSLRGRVHEVLSDDAEMILTYLRSVGGKMAFWDKSEPDAIRAKFGVSKAQFKRALGTLMKERRIKQEDGFTYLLENEDATESGN
nr:S1 RNA-binding domain-containing protein [Listeria rustica]